MDGALTTPTFKEMNDRAGHDLDDLAVIAGVGRTTRNEVAQLIAGQTQAPGSGCAHP